MHIPKGRNSHWTIFTHTVMYIYSMTNLHLENL